MWWRGVVMVMVMVTCVLGKPQEMAGQVEEEGPNPINNVWEYAFINDRSNLAQRAGASEKTTTSSNRNPCLWSIVHCCSASVSSTRDACFEELGCPGAWFDNLCSADFLRTAQQEVSRLFTQELGQN